jgi:repressor LexA
MQIVETFQNRLKEAMRLRDIKQVDLVEKTGLDKTLINKYLSGISNARQQKLTLLADALNVNEVWLMGYDVPIQRDLTVGTTLSTRSAVVFVYGIIPAGIPMECIEDVIDTEEISTDMLKGGKQYFGLKIKGNSMSPEYLDGDTIILEKVDNCESGQDCVVMVNGNDGTFKRVFKNETGIILQPLNPEFQPLIYTNEQIKSLPVRVIGKVVELRRKK